MDNALILFTFMVIFSALSGYAVAGKSWVYKVSLANPPSVFRDGLNRPAGGELNSFLNHLNGQACVVEGPYVGPRTGFLSFTGSREVAQRVAEAMAYQYEAPTYIYRIRGDGNIYPSLETARYMFNNNPQLGPLPDNLITTITYENEYISATPITAPQILDATQVSSLNNDPTNGHVTTNDLYSWGISSETNEGPYTGTGTALNPSESEATARATTYWNRAVNAISACFMNMVCNRNRVYGLTDTTTTPPLDRGTSSADRADNVELDIACSIRPPAGVVSPW